MICAALYLGWKEHTIGRDDLLVISGHIALFEKNIPGVVPNDPERYRFLKIRNDDRLFAIFIGRGRWDFAPVYERLDSIELDEYVTIYFEEPGRSDHGPIKTARFIDSLQGTLYVKGASKAKLAWCILGLMVATLGTLIWLKIRGKVN